MADTDVTEFWQTKAATLSDLFAAAVAAHPTRTYCKTAQTALTYAEAAAAIRAFAGTLGPAARGRTVALVLPNGPAFLIAYFGALAAGAAPALVNHAHPDATVAKLLQGMDIAAVLSDRTIPGLDVTTFGDDHLAELAARGGPEPDAAAPGDVAAILFSGGTTGLPKQIAHTHRMLIAAVERMEWGWPTEAAETWLPVAPFTHIYGFLNGVLNPVLRAGTLALPPRFHPDLIVDMLQSERVTVFGGGPPAIYQALMASGKFAGAAFPALRVCPGGGAPFPVAVLNRWQEATGLQIMEGYGMTEIAPICVNTAAAGRQAGAAGKAVPDTVIEIVDIDSGTRVLPTGETGEIRVKGPHMMTGYTGNAAETATALRDGFVYTGDIGRLNDAGFLVISDRKKDVIFVKGFNVFPREIEEALLSHDAVTGACVVGRTDTRAGELPVGYLTAKGEVNSETLLRHLETVLAPYKMPAELITLDAFPMTPAAKVDRAALRARANGDGA